VTDVMTVTEPRLPSYLAHFYDLGTGTAPPAQVQAISGGWRPFRTWTAVLVRVAADRLGPPYDLPLRRSRGGGGARRPRRGPARRRAAAVAAHVDCSYE